MTAAALESGAKVGSYVIEGHVGRGGTAEVYRARDASGSVVALKVLRVELLEYPEVVSRFLREAKAAEIVRHPNVVEVLAVGKEDVGSPYIVQELLEGEDLSQFVTRLGGKLSLEHVLLIMLPVVDAVAFAHRRGVVHRDLKPENVFLAKSGDAIIPKLLDFGISRFDAEAGETRITVAGQAVGTPAYMSPEQVQNAQDVDTRSDVWSLGTIMFELLSGRLPYPNNDARSLLVDIVTREPPKLRSVAGDLPQGVSRVVDRALKHNRAERYRSATELGRDLRMAITQETNLIEKYPHLRDQIGDMADSVLTSGVHMAVHGQQGNEAPGTASSSNLELDLGRGGTPMRNAMGSQHGIELDTSTGAMGEISRNTTEMITATGVTGFTPAAVGFGAEERKSVANMRTQNANNPPASMRGQVAATPNNLRATGAGTVGSRATTNPMRPPQPSVGNLRASTPTTGAGARSDKSELSTTGGAGLRARPSTADEAPPSMTAAEHENRALGAALHVLLAVVSGTMFWLFRHVDDLALPSVAPRTPSVVGGYALLTVLGIACSLAARRQQELKLGMGLVGGGFVLTGVTQLLLGLFHASGAMVPFTSSFAPFGMAFGGGLVAWDMWRRPKWWTRVASCIVVVVATMCLVLGVEAIMAMFAGH